MNLIFELQSPHNNKNEHQIELDHQLKFPI